MNLRITFIEFSGSKQFVRLDVSDRATLYVYFRPDTFICDIKDVNIEEVAEKICNYVDDSMDGKEKVVKWLKELLFEQFNV